MARLPRLALAGHLHHVMQRGNNGQPIAVDRADHERLLALLGENAARFGVALHAYLLLDNRLHLLATPATDEGLSQCMQALGRRYVRYFNDRHGRSGTLWEGRYRACVLQPERYLLPCMVWLDLGPVQAGLAARASDYPWSSHAHYAGLRHDRLLMPHPLYWALGNTPFAREAAYTERVQAGLGAAEQLALAEALQHGWAAGDGDFLAEVQKATPRRLVKGRAGRPPRPAGVH